jgi:hypothetical protein
MMFWTLLKNRFKTLLAIWKQPIKTRVAYIPLCPSLSSFQSEFDRRWRDSVMYLNDAPPNVPYVKVRIEIIELNEKYDHERKRSI